MKFAIISDTHLHNWKTFGIGVHPKWGWSNRLQEQIDTIDQSLLIAEKEKVDYFVHGGDWVHSVGNISNEVANALQHVLLNIQLPLITGTGNHDTVVRHNPKDAHILTNMITRLSDTIVTLPNVLFVHFYDEIDYTTLKGYDLVVIHKTPLNCRVGNYVFTDGVDWKTLASQNKQVAFGHVHQMQVLSDNCFVIGSPYHLTFGDLGDRGMWIVDTQDNTSKFIPLDSPKFLTVATPDLVKHDNNYYRVSSSETKIDDDRVMSIITPKKFDERITATEFHSVVKEWLDLQGKDETYLEVIKDILDEKFSLLKNVFKGRLAEVRIQDFGSVDEVAYKVGKGFTLVTGKGETFDSNGVGKTTVVGESLCWCLFDETTKGLKGDDVIRDRPEVKKDCSVEIRLIDVDADYIIRRTRKKGLEIYDMKIGSDNLVEGMRQAERQKYLEDLLGFNKQVFMSACYFSQENLVMLTGLGDTEKTNMVTDLLGFERYDDLYIRVSTKIANFEKDISNVKEEALGLDKKNAVCSNNIAFMDQSIVTNKAQLLDIEKLVDSAKDTLFELTLASKKHIEIREEEINKELCSEFQVELDTVEKTLQKVEEDLTLVKDTITAEAEPKYSLKAEMAAASKYIRGIQYEIDNLKGLKFGVRCDKCGAVVSEENAEMFIKEKEALIVTANQDIDKKQAVIEEIDGCLDKLHNKEKELKQRKELLVEQKCGWDRKIRELNTEIDQQARKVHEAKLAVTRLEGEIKTQERLLDDYNRQLTGLRLKNKECQQQREGYVVELEGLQKKAKEFEWRIDRLGKGIEVLQFWKVAFSPRGIRALLLDGFCNEINATVNNFLSRISGGSMSIVVSPTATLKSGEERNKIGMDILLGGLPRNYKSLSGGEKRRVDVSLCFGLNEWVSVKYGLPNGLLGVIIFDEVFSFMDKVGEEATANLLFEEGVNRAIFVIDHAMDLKSFADRVWTVRKVNHVSILDTEGDYE